MGESQNTNLKKHQNCIDDCCLFPSPLCSLSFSLSFFLLSISPSLIHFPVLFDPILLLSIHFSVLFDSLFSVFVQIPSPPPAVFFFFLGCSKNLVMFCAENFNKENRKWKFGGAFLLVLPFLNSITLHWNTLFIFPGDGDVTQFACKKTWQKEALITGMWYMECSQNVLQIGEISCDCMISEMTQLLLSKTSNFSICIFISFYGILLPTKRLCTLFVSYKAIQNAHWTCVSIESSRES